MDAKVNTQLANLKKQIDEVSKASRGRTASQNAQIKEASKALTDMINLEAKMVQKGATQERISQYNNLVRSIERYDAAVLASAEKERNVIAATGRLQDANRVASERFAAQKVKLEEKAAKASVDAYTDQIQDKLMADEKFAAEEKKIAEQANAAREKVAKEQADYNVSQ